MPMLMPPISADKQGASGEDYSQRNTALFHQRTALICELAELIGYSSDNMRGSVVLAAARDWEAPDTDTAWKRQQLTHRIESATRDIVVLNYGLVRDYAMRFAKVDREHLDDFEAAGLEALMYSIDTFDPERGRFGTWAYKPIQRAVLKAVHDLEYATITSGDFERRPEILATKTILAEELDRDPTVAEICERTGLSFEQVRRVIEPTRVDSIDLPVGDDRSQTLGDLIPDAAVGVEDKVLAAWSVQALETWGLPILNARETFVICRRYGIDGEPASKLSTIGATLRLSREAVRNIEGKAVAKLSHPSTLHRMLRHGKQQPTLAA